MRSLLTLETTPLMLHGLRGGVAAAIAGGDVDAGADAAGNAAENNFLPAVAALTAFIVSLTLEELAALSLFMAGGATILLDPLVMGRL